MFVIERINDYYGGEILCVSDSLQQCVDAANNHSSFPYLSDYLHVSKWENGKRKYFGHVSGRREDADFCDRDGIENYINIPVTFEELLDCMKECKDE